MKKTFRPTLIAAALTFYVCALLVVFLSVRHHAGGGFTAPQDDPYIHLALAEQIANGHYGINASEPSSPSSSMIWPLLLVPFAATSYGIYEALAWNALAGCCAVFILGSLVDEWPTSVLGSKSRRLIAVITFVLLANLVGLTLLCMEHTLQVMLAIACAAGMCRIINGNAMPWWSIAAAACAPWVRYEDFTLTLAIGLVLFTQRRRVAALVLGLTAVIPLIAFSLFLKHLDLPLLPVSVLVKSGTVAVHHGPLAKAFDIISSGALSAVKSPVHWPLLAIFLSLGALTFFEPTGSKRTVALAVAVAAGLHLLFGRFGWFFRYEVYIVVFSSIVLIRLVLERFQPAFAWYLVGACALSTIYLRALWTTPLASEAIYGQQYQMHRFVTDYYHGNFAVNDLGEVGYRHGDSYVLDLFGLASIEAAQERNKNAAWTEGIVRRHDVGLVMIYPNLFGIPAVWDKVGEICLIHQIKGLGGRCVSFYSTDPKKSEMIEKEFNSFAQTMPRQTVAIQTNP